MSYGAEMRESFPRAAASSGHPFPPAVLARADETIE
jgi:hypothetical protein